MTIHGPDDATAQRGPRPPASGTGVALPVAALVALTAAVIWFGISPSPPAASKAAGSKAAARPAGTAAVAPACGTCGAEPVAAADPLPSWNDGPTKQSILAFVTRVTREGGDSFVPVPERVAVFDNDGTLVCEKPIVHGMFLIDRLRTLAEKNPEIAHEEPYATMLTGDIDFVRRLGKKYLLDVVFTLLAGEPEERLEADTRRFLETARHPVFDVPYGEVTYQPMKELISLLRGHGFSIWICSGSGVHFMRPAAEAWYGIGPEHVIASRPVSQLREIEPQDAAGDQAEAAAGGSPQRRLELVVTPQLQVLNDEERKPVSIGEHIGRRPIFAAGNVGTTGDIEMLRWSQSGRHPNLQLLVLHDDAAREMAYGEPSNDSLEAAEKYGWTVVRMATDWNRIFARPLEKKAASPGNPSAPATSAPVGRSAGEAPAPPVAAVTVPRPDLPPPVRWEEQIAAFEQADRDHPPTAGGVVFLGSSNIRLWNTLADDFPGLDAVNRGVGGATLAGLADVVGRLMPAARPRAVVVSAGGNDIAAGASPAAVRDAFARLVANLRREMPDVRIAFLAIAPSIRRWGQREPQEQANQAVREFIAAQGGQHGLSYIDANAAFLGPDGLPALECFLDDQQHPSTIGNARRAAIMRPLLHDLVP